MTNYCKKIIFGLFTFLLVIGIAGCSSDDDNDKGLNKEEQDLYEKYVTAELQETIDELGVTIHRGINPPNVENYYVFYPKCIESTVPNDGYLGSSNFVPNHKRFYDQFDLKINALAYEIGSSTGWVKHVGDGSFITGEGDKFSIFFEEINTLKYNGQIYDQIVTAIYSAELDRDENNQVVGLKNFNYIFFMKDNDGHPYSIPNNTGRLFTPRSGDGLVETISKSKFDEIEEEFNNKKSLKANSNMVNVSTFSVNEIP